MSRPVGALSELSAGGLVADLADREQATVLVSRAEAAIGPVDIVIHNAAVDACARFDRVTADEIDAVVAVNLVVPGSVAQREMFARAQTHGIRVPRAMRLTTPEAVGRGVIKAIRTDAPEVLVYPGPIRPLLAFGALAPRLSERLNARLGLATLFRPAAAARGSGGGSPR